MNDDRFDREADRWERRPVGTSIRWGVATIVVVVALILVGGVAHFALGWLGAVADVAGPRNVKAQYAAVIEDWNAMEAAAANACGATDAPASRQGPTFLEDPAFAYKAKYRSITVDYNRRQANIFEAKEVGPGGYPPRAPALSVMEARVCGPEEGAP